MRRPAADEIGTLLAGRRDLTLELVSVDKLTPYPKNARQHSQAQIEQICANMRECGWTNPVLIDENRMILAGHGRILAARHLGLTDSIPCITLRGLTKTQKQAVVLADNKLALNATWDNSLLLMELGELADLGFPLETIGFNAAEMTALLHGAAPGEGLTDPDDTPVAPVKPVSVLGDTWILGRHRLVVGDSADATVVEKALNGAKPHLMVTDIPQGATCAALALFPGDAAYVWCAPGSSACVVHDALVSCNLIPRTEVVWARGQFSMGKGWRYHPQHENCWYAVRKGAADHWCGDRRQTTLWQISEPAVAGGGVPSKPVECMQRPIENNSSPGQAVYDPHSGAGTTIIAGEISGRFVHAIEIKPALADVAVVRWQQYAGMDAALDGDGRSFDELSVARKT